MRHLLLLLTIATVWATEVTGPLKTPFGTNFSGTITITAPSMVAPNGDTLLPWQNSYTITDGTFSVNLQPNDTATPTGTSYNVRCYTSTTKYTWQEIWVVPTSGTPLTVAQVRVATLPTPAVNFALQQLASTGAAKGSLIAFGSSWGVLTVGTNGQVLTADSTAARGVKWAAGGGGGAVWGAITGTLSDQADLNSALAGKAASSHDHASITGNAATATALAVDPAACTAGQYVTDIAADGTLTCAAAAGAQIDYREWRVICQNTVAGGNFSLPESNAPVQTCVTGTNTLYGQLDFADTGTRSVYFHTILPAGYTAIDFDGYWKSAVADAGLNVVWQLQLSCAADDESGDPAWDTARAYTEANLATANRMNAIASQTLTLPAGCAAGEVLFGKLYRDPAHASDTLGATASLVFMRLTITR